MMFSYSIARSCKDEWRNAKLLVVPSLSVSDQQQAFDGIQEQRESIALQTKISLITINYIYKLQTRVKSSLFLQRPFDVSWQMKRHEQEV